MLTLAHELGHGVHASLARPRGPYEQHTPLTVAETASVFGETLVFDRLLELATIPRIACRCSRKTSRARSPRVPSGGDDDFERRIHTARREEGELSVERFAELWTASQDEFFGASVKASDGYGLWWSYVPHFIKHARLRVRVRLRSAPRAVDLPAVPRAGAGFVPDSSSC